MRKFSRFFVRWLLPICGGVIALAAIFFLYRGLDFGTFVDGLRHAKLGWVGMLAATILLEQVLNGWKWRQILHDLKPISTLRLTGGLLAGYGANVLVPLGISPLVRSWLIARLEGLKMATVLTTTITARFIDGVVFALFAGLVAISGQVPQVSGNLELGLAIAGGLNLVLFGTFLWIMFRFRASFGADDPFVCRAFDRIAALARADGRVLRGGLCEGVIWPRAAPRRVAVIGASVIAKVVSATHFLWAGLAVGVVLGPFDYLFLMVFAGFSLVLSRFIRIPGGFVIGSAFALHLLGVPDEPALIMVLFNHIISILLVVGIGLVVLWQSGIDIRHVTNVEVARDGGA